MDQDKLKADNATLASALREKARKHQQIQELYDRLKRKEMTAATQSAAFDSVDEVLQSAIHNRSDRNDRGGPNYGQYQPDGGLLRRHRGQGSLSSGNSGHMMPPPMPRPPVANTGQGYRFRK